jgi:hypothetical protein
MVNQAMRSYEYAPARGMKLTNHSEVLHAFNVLSFVKALGRKFMMQRVLKHLTTRDITFSRRCLTRGSVGSSYHKNGNTHACYL